MTAVKKPAPHATTPLAMTAIGCVERQGKRYYTVLGRKHVLYYVEVLLHADGSSSVVGCDERCGDWVYRGKRRGEPCRHMQAVAHLLTCERDLEDYRKKLATYEHLLHEAERLLYTFWQDAQIGDGQETWLLPLLAWRRQIREAQTA